MSGMARLGPTIPGRHGDVHRLLERQVFADLLEQRLAGVDDDVRQHSRSLLARDTMTKAIACFQLDHGSNVQKYLRGPAAFLFFYGELMISDAFYH